ncbi:MAG: sigma-70 family RNA polymerase sigma factor [Holophagales bacterium]|nr:MAG: sigma-70 family RNA polymerase sigma factor [Holophagales bacterium]
MPQPALTALLDRASDGDRDAFDQVVTLVYEELRRIARGQRHRVMPGSTLETTALVHEAWMRLADATTPEFESGGHFLAVAARAMRFVLIDHARSRARVKRGGEVEIGALDAATPAYAGEPEALLDLERALTRLEALEPRLARVVECRHFLGLGEKETAAALGVSLRTVQRDWEAARRFVARELRPAVDSGGPA